ncbi:MAG: type II toxin-antitoxin system RelB/DinJ family antitoxin, partial [Lachnospiraceae bacterium]|nr:type II toxin-antitoxin system RelB/DinJ family antitoxin [Lachnospiraceae bacterium]
MVKNATVSARIDEDIKIQAEDILHQLGIPVSVLI